MPFTAPRFMDTPIGAGEPSNPRVAAIRAQDVADQALLAKLNRPGWTVAGRASNEGVDAKGQKTNVGTTAVTLAGPDGQSDQVIVDSNNNIVAGGDPQKTPDKPAVPPKDTTPSKPEDWLTLTDTQGNPIAKLDPKTGNREVIPKPTAATAARVDSPAETQVAATGAAAQAETERKNKADEADKQATQALTAARDAAAKTDAAAKVTYDNKIADIDSRYKDNLISEAQMRLEVDKAHYERQDATASLNTANQALVDENTRQYQQGQLANQATQTAESARHNTASETATNAAQTETARANQVTERTNAATLLERQQADQQSARNAAATTGAGLLRDRATLAQGANQSLMSLAGGAKNYGLGSSADVSGLPAAAQGWATSMMGGQSLFDQAAKDVHDANPAVSNTPQGAAYTALLEQVMGKQAQVQSGGLTAPGSAPPPPDPNAAGTETTAALAPTGLAGTVSPSDPRYLGTVIGQAIQHLNNSQLSPDSQFTAPGATV